MKKAMYIGILAVTTFLAVGFSQVWARGYVTVSAPSVPDANLSGTDKAPANAAMTVTFDDYPCVGTPGCSSDVPECSSGQSVELRWSAVDQSGNWISPQTTQMSCSAGPIGGGCGSWHVTWTAQIPAQPTGTRIEFVVHVYGNGTDKWIKDTGKKSGSFGNASECSGNTAQKGWPRIGAPTGSNFYFITIETPYVVIDYPQENETITSPAYTIRIGANASTNNARVKIDTGDWSQCRWSAGYWWFDWSSYPAGPHQIIAEGWNEVGQRSETSVRHTTYQP